MFSEEHRRKISDALKGKKRPDEVRKKISKSSMGKKGNSGSFKKGHKHSEEAIQKMKLAKAGKPTWNKGLTKETDSRLNFERPTRFQNGHSFGVRFGRDKDCSGENHSNWRGGISKEAYGLGWTIELKESVRKRDNFVCQECGIPQDELEQLLSVHHIDHDKRNQSLKNLISLCRGCHTTIHRAQ